jgi:hypothetical protein
MKLIVKQPNKNFDVKMVHWSATPNGSLLARAISFTYSKISTPGCDGGLKEFIDFNCHVFQG